MMTAAHQILQCAYHGAVRRLYLEGKALELIALLLSEMADERSLGPLGLRAGDAERLHEARRILLINSDSPPTIRQLARQTGVNEFKLKSGFRQLFGTTVYGCLRDHRMEQARNLLSEKTMNVAGVAAAVGYINATNAASVPLFFLSLLRGRLPDTATMIRGLRGSSAGLSRLAAGGRIQGPPPVT